jgi:hypothetical protein
MSFRGVRYSTPSQVWSQLNGERQGFLRRCERYAALTIPKLCLPEGHNHLTTQQTTDYQSLGAAAVNHLNNRILLSLFRPGDPFFRLDPQGKTKEMMKQLGVLLELTKETRVYGIRNFCVKRTSSGLVHTIVIREQLKFDELELPVRQQITGKQPETVVSLYRLICLDEGGKSYTMKMAVDEQIIMGNQYMGKWPLDKMPYHVIAWDLADEADYATGLVEEHLGDFEALSALSESLLDGSVLGTEIRWLVNPGGITSVDEFKKSSNGDAIAGQEGDISTVSGDNAKGVEFALKVIEVYSQRLARAFLLQSAMVRDAERVTAEEIRAIAMELETAFGGVYSQLGVLWQKPVAQWCMADIDLDVRGTELAVTVITGLDALTRNAALEKLRAALGDLALFEQLPDGLKARIDWEKIAGFVGAGRGVDLVPFLKSEKQVQAEQQQAMQSNVRMESGIAAGQATAKVAAEQGVQ